MCIEYLTLIMGSESKEITSVVNSEVVYCSPPSLDIYCED